MVAHMAHNYVEEIATLKHLIDLVSAQKQSVAGFRIYLAQAYEMDGQAGPALDEFQKALDEGTLGDEQRGLIDKQMRSIRGQELPEAPALPDVLQI
jgi:cytochrome c-type biogenesis protein CcmH/NrfG